MLWWSSSFLSAWVYCRSCACDKNVHIKIYSQKGQTCFTWYSHSAVLRDPVYSGWTPWLAAQKEAEDTVGVLETISLPAVDTQLSLQDNDVITYHGLRHAPPKVGDIVGTTSGCLDQLLNVFCCCCFVCLDANWEGWLTDKESKPYFQVTFYFPFSCLLTIWYPYWEGKSFLWSQILVHTAFLIKMLL